MRLIATVPARNEDWCLGLTLRAMLLWLDGVVVLDHASTDRTPEIIREVQAEHPCRVIALREEDPTWYEMRHRQQLLDAARQAGATHVAIVDADEILSGNLVPFIRDYFGMLGRNQILTLPWLMCWRSIHQYRNGDNSVWSRNSVSTGFIDAADLYWQIPDSDYCFHHRHPRGRALQPFMPVRREQGGLLHFQHASWRRLLAKQAKYQVDEIVRWPGRKRPQDIAAMYGGTVDETGLRTSPVPAEWWEPYQHLMQYIDVESEPWQEGACREIVAEHGRERFSGLNLFGVV